MKVCLIFAVLTIVAVSGNPRIRPEYVNVTDVYGPGDSYEGDECGAAIIRERCSGIMINAFRGSGKGFHSDIQHYCNTIPPFVPCLEANRADYLILLGCQDVIMMVMSQVMTEMNLTPDDVFDINVNFMDTVNDIVCSRTEEVVELVECVEKNHREAGRKLEQCAMDHLTSLINMIHQLPVEQDSSGFCGGLGSIKSLLFYFGRKRLLANNEDPDQMQHYVPSNLGLHCLYMTILRVFRSLYGFGECVRDTLVEICEDSTGLLDTAMDDVIQGVIGNGLGCEAPTNPILSFVRSVRNKPRR